MILGTATTPGSFRCMFQEFRAWPAEVVTSYLNQAAARIDATLFPALSYDEYHGNLAAHLMATSPAGISARLVAKDGHTTYEGRLEELRRTFVTPVTIGG